jgi:hypothetical protein
MRVLWAGSVDAEYRFFVVVTVSPVELGKILESKIRRFDRWRIKKVFKIKGLWVAVWYVRNVKRLFIIMMCRFARWDKHALKVPYKFERWLKNRP